MSIFRWQTKPSLFGWSHNGACCNSAGTKVITLTAVNKGQGMTGKDSQLVALNEGMKQAEAALFGQY